MKDCWALNWPTRNTTTLIRLILRIWITKRTLEFWIGMKFLMKLMLLTVSPSLALNSRIWKYLLLSLQNWDDLDRRLLLNLVCLRAWSHHPLPLGERTAIPNVQRRARSQKIPNRRREMHRLQTLRGNLPSLRHRHRNWTKTRRLEKNYKVWYWHDEMHFLRVLSRSMPCWCDCGRTKLWVFDHTSRGTVVWQGEVAF